MLGLTAALAGFFIAVVKQTEIFGPQNAAVREFFSENDFRHATHHSDPSVLRRVFDGIRIRPACIPVLAADAPSLRLDVAVLKQIREGLVVVVFVDPIGVEGSPRGIQDTDERDVVDLVVGPMTIVALEHWQPIANEAFAGVPRHDWNQVTALSQKRGGLFVQFDGKNERVIEDGRSRIKVFYQRLGGLHVALLLTKGRFWHSDRRSKRYCHDKIRCLCL